MRKPIVAGQFYPANFSELSDQIVSCFNHKRGPGELPRDKREGFVKAIIAPHAGYAYSGPCAAWAYKEIAEAAIPDFFLVLGPSHAGNRTCLSGEDWETPIGTVKSHKAMVKALSESIDVPIDDAAHESEHSIEVQLPFLQFACRSHLQRLRIVPLMVGRDTDVHKLGKTLMLALKHIGKTVCIIVSSDFTHYGASYGYMPFSSDVKKKMKALDMEAISYIVDMKPGKFLSFVDDTSATICGAMPIAIMLEAIDAKASLLQYYTSGDIMGDYSSAVGYASLLFR